MGRIFLQDKPRLLFFSQNPLTKLYHCIIILIQRGREKTVAWEFETDRPIYLQLIEEIQLRIVTGQYPAGSRLPAVRELAAEASVNPNTMQKALGELERMELVRSQRTSGRFITEDVDKIKMIRENLAHRQLARFLEQMQAIGYERQDIIRLLEAPPKRDEKDENNETEAKGEGTDGGTGM